jgi:flagellar M-ring protein FliF
MNPTKDDLVRYIELAVVTLLTIIVLLTVVRPLVRKVIGPETAKLKRLVTSAVPAGAELATDPGPMRESQAAKMIELARVNGQVQQQSLERIGELVKASPSESVSVLRQWIHERT